MLKNNKSPLELEIEKRIPIDVYFNKYIKPLKKNLNELSEANPRSCCPFHDETDPSFSYWSPKRKFHCFGCGVSGNIVRLHQLKCFNYERRKLDTQEAIAELVSMFQLMDLPSVVEKVEEVEHKGKIALARERLQQTYEASFSNEALTLTRYEKMQRGIMQYSSTETQIKMYNDLDMMACLTVSRVVDND